MAMTPKENYLAAMKFEKPEYVPYTLDAINMMGAMPNMYFEQPVPMGPEGIGKVVADPFGVDWTATADGMLPVNDHFLLDDITKWKEVVKIPNVDDYPWAEMAEKELAMADPNKVNWVVMNNGIFDRLMAVMGYNEGLCAMYEEPEACAEFFEAIADYKIAYIDKICQYYHPDIIHYVDDLAHANGLFMSPDLYRELIKPQHQRIVKAIRDHGILMEQHTCGKCEQIIPDYIEMGVQSWFPAQTSNHLKEIHESHKLAMNFGMDTQGTLADKDVSDDVVRSEIRKAIDELGDGGGLAIMSGAMLGSTMEELMAGGDHRMQAAKDEWEKYGQYTY